MIWEAWEWGFGVSIFGIGMHIKALAQLRATLKKSNVLSTLCPLIHW